MQVLDNICDRLNLHELEKVQVLKDLSVKTNVKPAYMGLAAITVVALFAIIGHGGTWLSFLIGFLYPAYKSFKALETKDDSNDDKQWLTYWVVFSFMHVFEDALAIVLSIIPFSNVLKIAFNIWLFHPRTKGALVIYESFLRDFLHKYESKIDAKIEALQKTVGDSQPLLENAARDLKREAVNRVIS